MLWHEQNELSKRSQELSVRSRSCNSCARIGESRSLVGNRESEKAGLSQLDQLTLSKELDRQMREDATSEEDFDDEEK